MSRDSVATKRLKLEPDTRSNDISSEFLDDFHKLTKTQNLSEIKSFIIFGNSLHPNNYDFKFAAYEYLKNASDYQMASSLLNEMYTKFQNKLEKELINILKDVKNSETSSNKKIFYCLDVQVQYDILKKFCEFLPSIDDQIVLIMEIIKSMSNNIKSNSNTNTYPGSRFYQLLACEIKHLLDLLSEAEDEWRQNWNEALQNDSQSKMRDVDLTLNFYRYQLATEVLPLVHGTSKGVVELVDKRMLTDLIMNSVQFYLSYVGFIPDDPTIMELDSDNFAIVAIHGAEVGTCLSAQDDHLRHEDVWLKLKRVLSMAGDMLKWYGCFASANIGRNSGGHYHGQYHNHYANNPHQHHHNIPNAGLPLPIVYESLSTPTYCRQVQALLDYASASTLNRQMILLQQIGCVVWVGLAELIMQYIRLSKGYLWYGATDNTTTTISNSSGDDDDAMRKYRGSVFLFCRGESECKLVNYSNWECQRMRQIFEAFSIAIKLYAAVPIKEWDKISEKVEPMIRSQNWAFDSMFFLDLSLLRRPLAKGKSYLRDIRLKALYPKLIRDLISATITQCNRDKNKKTLKTLLEILHSLTHSKSGQLTTKLSNLTECFRALPEMTSGYTYLIELSPQNILMVIVHLLHGWLCSVATSRFETAPEAASYLLVLDQVKLESFCSSNNGDLLSLIGGLRSQLSANIFILINEGTQTATPTDFVQYIYRIEIIEEIILQIEKYNRNNAQEKMGDAKKKFLSGLQRECISRMKSSITNPPAIEDLIMDFIKNFKSSLSTCIG